MQRARLKRTHLDHGRSGDEDRAYHHWLMEERREQRR
jgi:hypothetical protein